MQWDSTTFQASDAADASWTSSTEMKKATDVTNAPAGWTPDRTFVKRKVHFTEPPNENEFPNVRVQVERNVVDLDPGDLGSLVNESNLEVRVDNVGSLSVGPISLGAVLEGPSQLVEVTFRALGKTFDDHERTPVKFQWRADGQDEGRYWFVYTGQPDFIPKFEYQVRVVVRGTIFGGGQEWTGNWEQAGANGPLLIRVPGPDEAGVTRRSLNAARRSAPPPARRQGAPKVGAPPAVVTGSPARGTVSGYPVVGASRSATSRPGPSGAALSFSGFSAIPPSDGDGQSG